MGSFWGHIDEGLVLIILGLWWLFNMSVDYRKSLETGERFRSRISYDSTIRNKRLPLEIYLKISFTILVLSISIFDAGFPVSFVDENNRFVRLHNLQHMPIFGLFLIHGITDLLSYHNVSPIMKDLKYMTLMLSFFWLPLPSMFSIVLMLVWEMRQREVIFPQIVRCLCVLTLGTWFSHVSFILYLPAPFPGKLPNPAWNQTDMTNVSFAPALFGFHLIFNVLVIFLVFSLVMLHGKLVGGAKRIMGKWNRNHVYEYHKLDKLDQCDASVEKSARLINVDDNCD